jgi:hypothetical protein
MLLFFPQAVEHVRKLHCFINKYRRHQEGTHFGMPVFRHGFEKTVQIQHTDDIVNAALIHRQAGVRRLLDLLQEIVPGVFDIQRDQIHPCGHYF